MNLRRPIPRLLLRRCLRLLRDIPSRSRRCRRFRQSQRAIRGPLQRSTKSQVLRCGRIFPTRVRRRAPEGDHRSASAINRRCRLRNVRRSARLWRSRTDRACSRPLGDRLRGSLTRFRRLNERRSSVRRRPYRDFRETFRALGRRAACRRQFRCRHNLAVLRRARGLPASLRHPRWHRQDRCRPIQGFGPMSGRIKCL
jgi:hypothetical protein